MREQYLGIGVYSLSDARRLTRIPGQRLSRWIRGYHYDLEGRQHAQPPVIQGQLPEIDGRIAFGFLDLMEARFIDAFRDYGLSLQAIRRAAEAARGLLRARHPFSRHHFRTDGQSIFAEIAQENDEPKLLDLVRNQYALKLVLEDYLYEGLEFEEEVPVRWRPMPGNRRIVLDPERQFGQPIVEEEGVPTSVLSAAFKAEQNVERVARWFEVGTAGVRAAIDFESFLERAA